MHWQGEALRSQHCSHSLFHSLPTNSTFLLIGDMSKVVFGEKLILKNSLFILLELTSLTVGNVPYNMGEDQLIDVFKSAGQVVGFR